MANRNAPIGAMDSGVGGLTAVRELRRALPKEEILFLGDSANCPYGNRSEDEIFELSMRMLRRFEREGVKCVVIACNTISALTDRLRRETELKLFSVVESTVRYISDMGIHSAGLIATESTVNSGVYEHGLSLSDPSFRLTAVASRELAGMIDRGIMSGPELEGEIRLCVDRIIERGENENLILGCTHYPLVLDSFVSCYPGLRFIDAARAQAEEAAQWLKDKSLLREGGEGTLHIRTSGSTENFLRSCAMLGIDAGMTAETVDKM